VSEEEKEESSGELISIKTPTKDDVSAENESKSPGTSSTKKLVSIFPDIHDQRAKLPFEDIIEEWEWINEVKPKKVE